MPFTRNRQYHFRESTLHKCKHRILKTPLFVNPTGSILPRSPSSPNPHHTFRPVRQYLDSPLPSTTEHLQVLPKEVRPRPCLQKGRLLATGSWKSERDQFSEASLTWQSALRGRSVCFFCSALSVRGQQFSRGKAHPRRSMLSRTFYAAQ